MSILQHFKNKLKKQQLDDSNPQVSSSGEDNLDEGHKPLEDIIVNDVFGKGFSFSLDEDFGGLSSFQNDLERELDDIAEKSINEAPRIKYSDDEGVTFDKIASTLECVDERGLVKKKIISKGIGNSPPPFARVVVHYDFYKEGFDEPFDSTYLRGKPCKLRLDEREIIPGLEIAIKSMKRKEFSKFLIKWEVAFGRQGCPPRIPKECDILAYVSLVDFTELVNTEEDVEYNNGELKLNTFGRVFKDAKYCHCEGNEEFALGNVKAAIRSYRKCIAMLNDARLAGEDDEKRMFALKVKCLVNLSVCFNKISKPQQACVVGRQALAIDNKNIKAMYQYGKANLILSNLDIAEKWLKKAYLCKPDDDDILRELNKLAKKKEKAKAADTLFCRRAFSYFNEDKSGKK